MLVALRWLWTILQHKTSSGTFALCFTNSVFPPVFCARATARCQHGAAQPLTSLHTRPLHRHLFPQKTGDTMNPLRLRSIGPCGP